MLTTEKKNLSDELLHYNQNMNRLSGNIIDLKLKIDKIDTDIICLTETWVKLHKLKFNVYQSRKTHIIFWF